MDREKQNVFKVYDRIAGWFFKHRSQVLEEKKYLDEMISQLPAGAAMLDLGCGTGKPVMDYLLEKRMKVTGMDASIEMLNLAKQNFPSVEFILCDMRELSLNKKFDALIAWHSFFHLPAADQPAMFRLFREHLVPGGLLLFTSGTELGEAWGENGGAHLFHSSLDSETYIELLTAHGFTILEHVVNDPDCGYATVWLAQYQPEN